MPDAARHDVEDRVSRSLPSSSYLLSSSPPADPPSPQQSEEGSVGLPDLGDSIDAMTFEQILEMDDDED
jgi:hypothetical protein